MKRYRPRYRDNNFSLNNNETFTNRFVNMHKKHSAHSIILQCKIRQNGKSGRVKTYQNNV